MVFGFIMLLIVAALILAIALGKVEEKTSYGLQPMLIILTVMAEKWAAWAFGKRDADGTGGK